MLKKLGLLISCALLLSGCVTAQIPDIKICSVAGVMSAGASCAQTLSDKTEDMDLNKWIEFLEPQSTPPRSGALCMSSDGFSKLKTALEQLCSKAGRTCTKEVVENLKQVSARIDDLQSRVISKKPKAIVHPIWP
jgi:hypothetical protein